MRCSSGRNQTGPVTGHPSPCRVTSLLISGNLDSEESLMSNAPQTEFEKAAANESGGNVVGEFWFFLRTHKKWWLLPILAALLLLGLVMVLSTSAAAPFIYTM